MVCPLASLGTLALGLCAFTQPPAAAQDLPAAAELVKLYHPSPDDYVAFGYALDLDGSTLAIGAPGEPEAGATYVFEGRGGTWMLVAKLTPGDSGLKDFGSAVALDGDTLIIGAPGDDHACPNDINCNSGSAYVFVRDGAGWSQQAKLLPGVPAASDRFGSSVAVDGNSVLVGEPRSDDLGADAGAAHVFTRTGTVWSDGTRLLAQDGSYLDNFGDSVGLHENTAVVGATHAGNNLGAAYVFVREAGVWSQTAKLLPSDVTEFAQFGQSVAIHAGTIAVGAPLVFWNGIQTGAAYVFVGSGSSWSEEAKLGSSAWKAADSYGEYVSLRGHVVAVSGGIGVLFLDPDPTAAWVFTRSGTRWRESAALSVSDPVLAGPGPGPVDVDTVGIAFGYRYDGTIFPGSGAVYLFPFCPRPAAYGVSAGGANVGELLARPPSDAGGSIDLQLEFPRGGGVALLLLATAPAALPALGGTLLIDTGTITALHGVPLVSGAGHHPLDLPHDPALELHAQALLLDCGQPLCVALSNGLRITVCP